jgi:four helix bundle protein
MDKAVPSNSFENVIAWQRAHQFVLYVYKTTKEFPNYERFGLSSQFQRAAVSIAANIAEGYKKKGAQDKLRFFNIAQGSIEECRYYIILANDLEYVDPETSVQMRELLEETSKLLNAYCKSILNSAL